MWHARLILCCVLFTSSLCDTEVGVETPCTNGTCLCTDGFSPNGTHCVDIDECETMWRTECDSDHWAACVNTVGGYACSCYGTEFEWRRSACRYVGRCRPHCHVDAECIIAKGKRKCQCNEHFTGDGTICTVNLGVPTVSKVGMNSIEIDSAPPPGVGSILIEVLPKQAHEAKRTILTTKPEKIEDLTHSTIYSISVTGINRIGTFGIKSESVEIRTLPKAPSLRLSSPTSEGVVVFFLTNDTTSISQWQVKYRKEDEVRETETSSARGQYGATWLSELTPNTNYFVRARAKILFEDEEISYATEDEGYSSWESFKTRPLSLFGVVTKMDTSGADSTDFTECDRMSQAQNIIECVYRDMEVEVEIVEVEENEKLKMIHFRLNIGDSSKPSSKSLKYTPSNSSTLFDWTIDYGDYSGEPSLMASGNKFGLSYIQPSGLSCDESFANASWVVTQQHDDELQVVSSEHNAIEEENSLTFTNEGIFINDRTSVSDVESNEVYGLQPRLFVKQCIQPGRFLYAEYFKARDARGVFKSVVFHSTDPPPYNERDITYSNSEDKDSVLINITAVDRAFKYQLVNATGGVLTELTANEIDGSQRLKIPVFSLENLAQYNFSLNVFTKRMDGTTAVTRSGIFNVFPNKSQCSECVDKNRGDYCMKDIFNEVECFCDKHYEWAGGIVCKDFDECKSDITNNCDKGGGECINTEGSFNCSCKPGYTGNGTICEDINECNTTVERYKHNCNGNATCNNTFGSYECACNPGFNGTGYNCTEINECLSSPCEDYGRSICNDLINAFRCDCLSPYTGDGVTVCGEVGDIRLTGNNQERMRNQGYVEILATPNISDWRSICSSSWSYRESNVACRMLSYLRRSFLDLHSAFEEPKGLVWVKNLSCSGEENDLVGCAPGTFGQYTFEDCLNNNSAWIHCSNTTYKEMYAENVYTTRNGSSFTFRCKRFEAGRMINSEETCDHDGRSAAIECKGNPDDTSKTGVDFVYATFAEFRCNSTVQELQNEAANDGGSHDIKDEVEKLLGDLSAITGNMTKNLSAEDDPMLIPKVINTLCRQLVQKNVKNEKPTAFYLGWTLDNFNQLLNADVDNGNGTNEFNDTDKMEFVKCLRIIAQRVILHEPNITVSTPSVSLKVNITKTSLISYEGYTGEGRVAVLANITETPEQKIKHSTCYFLLVNNSAIYPPPGEDAVTVSKVLTLGFSEEPDDNETRELDVRYPFGGEFEPLNETDNSGNLYFQRCGYLDSATNTWKSAGCKTVLKGNFTFCKCHRSPGMAGFGVLVKTYAVADSLALSIFSSAGCVASTFCLLVLVVVYLAFKTLRENDINQLHINLSISLMISYMTFMFGLSRTRNYASCLSAAAVLHFSLLSAWGWMLVESITMFKKFVMIFSRTTNKYLLKCAVIVYTFSASVVVTNVVVATKIDEKIWENWTLAYAGDIDFRPSVYISDKFCWLHGYSLYFGFLTPIGIILFINLISMICITRKIIATTSNVKAKTKKARTEAQEHIIRTVMIAVILGLPWATGVPLTLTSLQEVHDIFGWLFSIFAAYQGVFIFLLFCVKRKEVRKLCKDKFSKSVVSRFRSSMSDATVSSAVSSSNLNPRIYQETAISSTTAEYRSRYAPQ